MSHSILQKTSSLQAEAIVNEWPITNLGDRLVAYWPQLNEKDNIWRVPVLLVYPKSRPLGIVGEFQVDASTGQIVSHTPAEEIHTKARKLYETSGSGARAPSKQFYF